jgi:hypothetical protein
VVAPDGRELVDRRQEAVAVGRDDLDGKVILQEGNCKAGEADRGEHQNADRQGRCQRHRRCVAALGAPQRDDAEQERQAQRKDEGEVTELGNHEPASARRLAEASMASATSGGM